MAHSQLRQQWFKLPLQLVYLTVAFLLTLTGNGQAQLFLEDGKVNLSVSGGERISNSITLHNTSPDTLAVRVYWEDFEYQPPYAGQKQFLPGGTGPRSADGWVTVTPRDFSMPPHSRQKIDYVLNVPPQINRGHYGVLFFENQSNTPASGTGVDIVTRVGCLFFIEPKEPNKNAVLENLRIASGVLTADFNNKGNVILIPKTSYYLMDSQGMIAGRGEAGSLYVPPGAVAQIKLKLPDSLRPGRYDMVINADLDKGALLVREASLEFSGNGALEIEDVRD